MGHRKAAEPHQGRPRTDWAATPRPYAEAGPRGAVLALQGRAGNRAVTSALDPSSGVPNPVLQRKNPPTQLPEITVSTPVRQLAPDETATDFITEQVQKLVDWEQEFWASYERGIGQFERTLMDGEDAEEWAPSEFLSRVFAGAVEGAIDTLIPAKIANKVIQGVAASLKESSFGLRDDIKDMSQKGAEVKIVEFVNGVVDELGAKRKEALTNLVGTLGTRLKSEYWRMKPEYDSESPHTNAKGILVGQYAKFLNDLEQMATQRGTGIPESRYFQQQLSERFATTGARTTYISRGGRPSGRLYLKTNIRFDGKQYFFMNLPTFWTLATNAPNRAKVATSLKQSLAGQNKTVIDSNLDKYVELRVYHTSGTRGIDELLADAYHGTFTFRYRDSGYEIKNVEDRSVVDAWKAVNHYFYKIDDVKAGN